MKKVLCLVAMVVTMAATAVAFATPCGGCGGCNSAPASCQEIQCGCGQTVAPILIREGSPDFSQEVNRATTLANGFRLRDVLTMHERNGAQLRISSQRPLNSGGVFVP